jgi:serine protease Do
MRTLLFLFVITYNLCATDLSSLYEKLNPAVVMIAVESNLKPSDERADREQPFGSGFIIASEGLVVTNYHVVRSARKSFEEDEDTEEVEKSFRPHRKRSLKKRKIVPVFKILDYQGVMLTAKVVFEHNLRDIAILKITDKDFKGYPKSRVLTLADSSVVKVGQQVFTIGSPMGIFNSMHTGIISGLHRQTRSHESSLIYGNLIQTDTNYSPGVSGSPLFNMKGEVLGINTMLLSSMMGGQVDMAVPSNILKRAIHDYHKYKASKMSFIGVEALEIPDMRARKKGYKTRLGVTIINAFRSHPGYKQGLRVNDRIMEVDSRVILNSFMLRGVLQEFPIGKTVNIKIQRNKKILILKIKLGDMDNFKMPKNFSDRRLLKLI